MILIATDSFKDSLPAFEVCEAIQKGFQLADCQEDVILFPLADGGEGTSEILTFYSQGTVQSVEVFDPLFRKIKADFGISKDGKTAFMEMASAAGLQLLKKEERIPFKTTTFGVGEMILEAVNLGVEKILLGIGGSATNDCGIGLAAALGFRFLDENETELNPVGENLNRISKIDDSNLKFKKEDLPKIEVICDVENPLYGKNGAAYVYAKQKGATDTQIEKLDNGLRNFSEVLKKHFQNDFSKIKGGGAAGGTGAGLTAFLNAKLKPGIDLVLDFTGFEEKLKNASLVITGEGKIDSQTLNGKLIKGITERAHIYNIPVIAFCGTLTATTDEIKELGLAGAFSIVNQPCDLDFALRNAEKGLTELSFNVYSLLRMSPKSKINNR